MRYTLKSCARLFVLLLLVLSTVPISAQPFPDLPVTRLVANAAAQAQFPEATEPCTPEVAKWWQDLRAAITEAADASQRKRRAIMDAHNQGRSRGRKLPTSEDVLTRQERDQLNAAIETATKNYLGLIREAQEKAYRAPVKDSRPLVLYTGRPEYTDQARDNKTMGSLNLRVQCLADGNLGEVRVVGEGLADGLNEQAIKVVRETIFLPAIKDGVFQTAWVMMMVEFSLR